MLTYDIHVHGRYLNLNLRPLTFPPPTSLQPISTNDGHDTFTGQLPDKGDLRGTICQLNRLADHTTTEHRVYIDSSLISITDKSYFLLDLA